MIKVFKHTDQGKEDITDRFLQLVKAEGLSLYEFIMQVRAEGKVHNIYVVDEKLKNQWKLY
ncbi:hypothetical protein [Halobacillus litoralis]|uniref:hypothetical protein n=1 Tax=Halobacillus litoralis TaxID=45668 RepID=UPI001CD5CEC1|nr:hypothetical protein [Halobacillus litoralis]MCA1021597.1 hypothetical protein [Halobacillus litoralis]